VTDAIKALDLEANTEISGNMAEIGKGILQNSLIESYRYIKLFGFKISGLQETHIT
jgi:hypothetical protein